MVLGSLHWVTSLLLRMTATKAPVWELRLGAQSASRSRFPEPPVFETPCLPAGPLSRQKTVAASVKNLPFPPVPRLHRPHPPFRIMIQAHKRRRCIPAVYPRVYPGGFTGCRAVPRRAWLSSPAEPLHNRIFQHFAALCRVMPDDADKCRKCVFFYGVQEVAGSNPAGPTT